MIPEWMVEVWSGDGKLLVIGSAVVIFVLWIGARL